MSFPRYPAYKDSGVEWLGEVPDHWKLARLKNVLAAMGSGGTPDTSRESFWSDNGGIPWVSISDMSDRAFVESTAKHLTQEGVESKGLVVWGEGTLLFSMYASLGHVAELRIAATTNQAILALLPQPGVQQRYLKWWIQFLRPYLKLEASSNTQDNLNAEKVRNLTALFIPLAEQNTISAFLDRETAKIDALIAEQERLIELMQEKRQAVISHAVTKGLNPDVPMKPSGVEWLGDVPEHWDVVPLGRLCALISYGFTNPMPISDEGPCLLTANDVQNESINYEGARRTTVDAFENLLTDKSRPQANDILITKDGTLGRVAVHDGRQACINQSVALIRLDRNTSPRFVATCLLGGVYQERMLFDAGGTTIKHIYISRLAKMPVAIPPLAEQDRIVGTIGDKTKRIDALMSEAERTIRLLRERRSALISAAVTGQIDVRGLVEQ